MSALGGIPHNGKGPASHTAGDYTSWEEFCEQLADGVHGSKINPNHYMGHNGIECHQVQRAVLGQAGMGAYWHGNAIKYIFRAIKKNGSEDIRKAIRCLQFWLDEVDPGDKRE